MNTPSAVYCQVCQRTDRQTGAAWDCGACKQTLGLVDTPKSGIVTAVGVVARGQGAASGWMHRDPLYTTTFRLPLWAGTINLLVETDQHLSLREGGEYPLLFCDQGVDPRFIRSMRRIVYRECKLDSTQAFVIRSKRADPQHVLLEIIAPHIPYIHHGLHVTFTFDPTTEPSFLPVASR